MDTDIWIATQDIMEGVVLQMWSIQVSSSVFVDSILSNDSFKVVHCEKVRVVPARGYKSNSNACVWNLIISIE